MRQSAGIMAYRSRDGDLEILIAHPGGPFWANRDDGVWTIPKGETEDGEDPLLAAKREFSEELGVPCPDGPFLELGSITQKSGKTVTAWAVETDLDPAAVMSNTFTMEWPPRSGQQAEFPEIDRVEWASPARARAKLNPAQAEMVDRLLHLVSE